MLTRDASTRVSVSASAIARRQSTIESREETLLWARRPLVFVDTAIAAGSKSKLGPWYYENNYLQQQTACGKKFKKIISNTRIDVIETKFFLNVLLMQYFHYTASMKRLTRFSKVSSTRVSVLSFAIACQQSTIESRDQTLLCARRTLVFVDTAIAAGTTIFWWS